MEEKKKHENVGVLMVNLERVAKLQIEILKDLTTCGDNRDDLSMELAKTMVWTHATLISLGWGEKELETLTMLAQAALEDEADE